MERELKSLKRRIHILEAKSEEEGKSSEVVPASTVAGNEKELESALKGIAHILADDVNTVMKRVVMQVFSQEELIKCNRKGKKKADGPKPALDEQKLFFVEKIVLTKCPSVTKEIFVKKFDNILKVVRRVKGLDKNLPYIAWWLRSVKLTL